MTTTGNVTDHNCFGGWDLGGLKPDGHQSWGSWSLDPKWLVLRLKTSLQLPADSNQYRYRYEVDLERCLSSAQVLDHIMQVKNKIWADDATLAGLVRALDDILHPQGSLCSFGNDKRMTRADIRQRVDEFVARTECKDCS